jgi:hypothetical protein
LTRPLFFSASSLQADDDHVEDSLLDPDHDDFNVDGNTESMDDWFDPVDLSQKNPSKITQKTMMEVSPLTIVPNDIH